MLATEKIIIEDPKQTLLRKIWDHSALVGMVGLGYVGLPLAVEKAKVGYRVIGIDKNSSRVKQLNQGQNYISDVKTEELRDLLKRERFHAVSDFSNISDMDVIVITVPTPLTEHLVPDLSYVEDATREIASKLRPGQLISLESTTYPGTTEEVMLPILEKSGLKVEQDFFLVHSPERIDPGNHFFATSNINKLVGGVGIESLEVAVAFYSQAIPKIVPVSSAWVAEMAKVYENTFRSVNIALVNEMAMLCDRMGLNVWEVLDAAFTKPFGIMPFYPGPGVGGHCIPLDPHYLEWKAKEHNFTTHFISLAGEINRSMPQFVRDKTIRILNRLGLAISKAKILVVGVAYKKNVSDYRESPALDVIRLLLADNTNLAYHDPYVATIHNEHFEMSNVNLSESSVKEADLVLILTSHSNIDYEWLVSQARHVFDTRYATKNVKHHREKITML